MTRSCRLSPPVIKTDYLIPGASMKHLYTDADKFPSAALLIKSVALKYVEIKKHYADPLNVCLKAMPLEYNSANKAPASMIKEVLPAILANLDAEGITTVIIADSAYFKAATRQSKADPHYGYKMPCTVPGYEHMNVFLTGNYQGLFYNPRIQDKITLSLSAIAGHLSGNYQKLGQNVIRSAKYVEKIEDIRDTLETLKQYPVLTCDVETYGLSIDVSRIGTIAFAWNQHEGVCLNINHHLYRSPDERFELRKMFRDYFTASDSTYIYHNATFDIRCIIYDFFMNADNTNFTAMIDALDVMYRKVHDTKIITYLATNNTAENKLSLKENAFEFAGNYAQEDIQDIKLIRNVVLMEYNLVDCLSTWYVFNKYHSKMITDDQLDIYNNIFIPSLKNITQMELTGMPMDMNSIQIVSRDLKQIMSERTSGLLNEELVQDYLWLEQKKAFIKKNALLKTKFKPLDDFTSTLNTNSPLQLSGLLYGFLGLPVLDTTDTGQPATGKKTIQKLYNSLINEYDIKENEL